MAGDVGIKLDTSVLDDLDRQAPGRADQVVAKIAFDYQAYVETNFSSESPSAPGDTPGIDTGTLKNSIEVEKIEDRLYHVNVAVDYGADLEYGTVNMAARPYMMPAAEEIAPTIPDAFKVVVTGES